VSKEEVAPTIVTVALVLRGPLRDFDTLKEILGETFPQFNLIYQKVSPGSLRIVEGAAK